MNKKILIVEDSRADRNLMKRFLNDAGFSDIMFSVNGEEGVDMARKEKPDIVVLDTQLPGIDGFETCRQIKGISGLSTKIIVMTGQIDAVDAVKARAMGADEYCVKTMDCSTIIDAVNTI